MLSQKHFLKVILIIGFSLQFAFSQYGILVHKTDNTATWITLSEVDSISFSQISGLLIHKIDQTTTSIALSEIDSINFTQPGTIADIDGNVYQTVTIGSQVWMAENLKVTRYSNGDAIPNVTDNTEWSNLSTGAHCSYDNDINNKETYGLLYNNYALSDSRNIAPPGWHVPTDEEWKEMEMYLGMSQSDADATSWRGTDEGDKIKAESGWYNNGNGTNSSGFSALPGGHRLGSDGTFHGVTSLARFWTATEIYGGDAWRRNLSYLFSDLYRYYFPKTDGVSVRLVKD